MRTIFRFTLAMALLVGATSAWAQNAPAPKAAKKKAVAAPVQPAAPAAETAISESPAVAITPEQLQQLDELKKKDQEKQAKIDELTKRDQERVTKMEALEKKMSDISEAQAEAQAQAKAAEESAAAQSFERQLSIYGFYDVTFQKMFTESDSGLKNVFGDLSSTFTQYNLNLYIGTQITQQLSSLVELRFSFLPAGNLISTETYAQVGNQQVKVSNYQVQNTTVHHSMSQQFFRQGGVGIERVHLTYNFNDAFNIIAGKFLTPYGIWNIDHGSTVVLPISLPYTQLAALIPLSQLGVQAYGRFFPSDETFIDYAFTVSNGRGPYDEYKDINENKAVGLRLRGKYEGTNGSIALGGYGYYGTYRDNKIKTILDTATGSLKSESITTEEYDETALSADILINYLGISLQGEFIFRRVMYDVGYPIDPRFAQSERLDASLTNYITPSYIGKGGYGMLSYVLPLKKWLGATQVIPYFFAEQISLNDLDEFQQYRMIRCGLDVRPNSALTLKVEGGTAMPLHDKFGLGNLKAISAQAAMNF